MIGLKDVSSQSRSGLANKLQQELNQLPGRPLAIYVDESGKIAGAGSMIATMKAYVIYDDSQSNKGNIVYTEVSAQTRNKLANKIQDAMQSIGSEKFIAVYNDEGGKLAGGGLLALGKAYIFYYA